MSWRAKCHPPHRKTNRHLQNKGHTVDLQNTRHTVDEGRGTLSSTEQRTHCRSTDHKALCRLDTGGGAGGVPSPGRHSIYTVGPPPGKSDPGTPYIVCGSPGGRRSGFVSKLWGQLPAIPERAVRVYTTSVAPGRFHPPQARGPHHLAWSS